MGDYTKNNKGHEVKIGTCGAGYYTTFKQLQKLHTPSNDAKHYLEKHDGTTYVFPFPDHDHKECGTISQFHSNEKIHFFINIPEGVKVHHSKIAHHMHPKGGAQINVFFDCPHENEHVSNNFDKKAVKMSVDYQVVCGGKFHVMGGCIYCNEQNYFSQDEAVQIVEFNAAPLRSELLRLEGKTDDNTKLRVAQINYQLEVLNRILSTYEQ